VERQCYMAPFVRSLIRHTDLGAAKVAALPALDGQLATYTRGAVLYRQGERPDNFYVIQSGSACRATVSRRGARQIFAVHMRGDAPGLTDEGQAAPDQQLLALSAIEMFAVPKARLAEVVRSYPDIARALWREVCVTTPFCDGA